MMSTPKLPHSTSADRSTKTLSLHTDWHHTFTPARTCAATATKGQLTVFLGPLAGWKPPA